MYSSAENDGGAPSGSRAAMCRCRTRHRYCECRSAVDGREPCQCKVDHMLSMPVDHQRWHRRIECPEPRLERYSLLRLCQCRAHRDLRMGRQRFSSAGCRKRQTAKRRSTPKRSHLRRQPGQGRDTRHLPTRRRSAISAAMTGSIPSSCPRSNSIVVGTIDSAIGPERSEPRASTHRATTSRPERIDCQSSSCARPARPIDQDDRGMQLRSATASWSRGSGPP